MRASRKRRLVIAGVLVTGVSVAVLLTLLALRENINLFYSPSQVVAGEVVEGSYFRIGGMVVDGSVRRNPDDLQVSFDLTDTAETVTVHYSGILPDLFREGQGIVALGRLEDHGFRADQVLAKHDENYMPPEVSEALKAANRQPYAPAATGGGS
ncbi:MAG: cytochrome c maturation protein CcmE [Gammaproteobacteria bacterium]|nr:cytochrome c maturation protein CcmE [Gammaproteobacteria bacterium]